MSNSCESHEAYQLVPPGLFAGRSTTYSKKVHGAGDGGESARNDPMGFYHGMKVTHGRETFVMVGPEPKFVPAEVAAPPAPAEQTGLFGEADPEWGSRTSKPNE